MRKQEWTPEERRAAIERSERLADHGLPPKGPLVSGSPAGPVEVDPDAYTAADLAQPTTMARRKRMPNGKWLWVHPLGLEQVMWMNGQATRHLANLRLQDNDPARGVAYRVLAWVYQTIACCRTGPHPNAPAVYNESHAEALFRNPDPGSECIQEIVALCDELGRAGGGQGLTPELVDFFGGTASWLEICALRLTTDSLESSRTALEDFAAYVSRIALQRTFSKADLEDVPLLPAASVPAPIPAPDAAPVTDPEAAP